MYVWMVILSMFALPVASILAEAFLFHPAAVSAALIGKWFVFWAVGVRLVLAGMRQSITPEFTARRIFHIQTREPWILVQELGFANLSIGLLGLCSLIQPLWIPPSAVAGGLFYGLAGIRHLAKKDRNRLEDVAMVSDMMIFAVLLAYCLAAAGNF
jgi:hypothetical protein